VLSSFENALQICKTDLASMPEYASWEDRGQYAEVLKKSKSSAERLMEHGMQLCNLLSSLSEFGERKPMHEYLERWRILIQNYCILADNIYHDKLARENELEAITVVYYNLKPYVEFRLGRGKSVDLIARALADAKERDEREREMETRRRTSNYLLAAGILLLACAVVFPAWSLSTRGYIDTETGIIVGLFLVGGLVSIYASGYPEKVKEILRAIPWPGMSPRDAAPPS
jgi:hypothetical protein